MYRAVAGAADNYYLPAIRSFGAVHLSLRVTLLFVHKLCYQTWLVAKSVASLSYVPLGMPLIVRKASCNGQLPAYSRQPVESIQLEPPAWVNGMESS